MKGKSVYFCTADHVPTVYSLTLKLEAGGRVSPEGIGDFFDDRLTVDLIDEIPAG